ncbi:MAG: sensor histidine kinase [Scytonematopsis contorta HA4267-MV1]|jgi:signal transduction histidine kinase|nr:sensor histidine kinase [Scytonematopsis contorta HA4267-MV1]
MNIALRLKRNIKLEQHPLRLLLYMEWILFGISIIIMNLPPSRHMEAYNNINPTLLILSISIFGAMGLRLPNGNQLSKLIYILVELLLIVFANIGAGFGIGFAPGLLLIVVIRSILILQFTGSVLVACFVWVCCVFTINAIKIPLKTPPPPEMLQGGNINDIVWIAKLNFVLLFSLVLIFVLLLVNALFAELQSRQQLALAHERLREYALRIEDQATLQERNRIAREIHDALGHSLTAQSIQLENALVYLESNLEKAKGFLLEARQLSANVLQEVRYSVATLHSDPLQGKSLDAAIKLLIVDFQSRMQITPDYSLRGNLSIPHELNGTVYRIIQEALTNISKHSKATEVKIDIQATTDSFCLRVEDNGIGFDPKENTTGFGLKGMQERTSALGGQFYITSKPQGGCHLMALFPSH